MASVSVRECIRVCRRSARHINWQTGTAVSEVDTSNLLLQKRMPPPECASLISNLVLISSCCPLRRIRWQLVFEETFLPSPSLHRSLSILHLSLSLAHSLSVAVCSTEQRPGSGGRVGGGGHLIPVWKQCQHLKGGGGVRRELLQQFMIGNTLSVNVFRWLLCFLWRMCECQYLACLSVPPSVQKKM